MSVQAAYLGVILIWSTTPLAIKWSGESAGFVFAVSSRMAIGLTVLLLITAVMRTSLPRHKTALLTYLAAGLGIYFTMISVYWSAAFIPSGWISVIFGLSPMITGLFAGLWLNEKAFTPRKTLGLLLALTGLFIIFGESATWSEQAFAGIVGTIVAVIAQSSSAVLVKKINDKLPAIATTTGSMLVATPLFLITWLLSGATVPNALDERAVYSIIYLGIMGSVVGFALYYYVLHHVSAMRVALLALMTPVTAMLVGHWFNNEPLQQGIWLGSGFIMAGLLAYENVLFKSRLKRPSITQ